MTKQQRALQTLTMAVVLLGVFLAAQAQAQVVDFLSDRNRAAPGQIVTFYDFSTFDNILQWEWRFGDGSVLTVDTIDPVTHAYANLGFYDVTLEVRGEFGFVPRTKNSFIQVLNPPFAEFIYANREIAEVIFDVVLPGVIPENAILFQDKSLGSGATGPPVAWSWDFGDGNTSTAGPLVFNIYALSGQSAAYTVTLTVTFADNSTQTIQKTIVVGAGGAGGGDIDNRNAAEIILNDAITLDGGALLPLHDWMPLFSFEMISADPQTSKSAPAKDLGDDKRNWPARFLFDPVNDRTISRSNPMVIIIQAPPSDQTVGDIGYRLHPSDILEFCLFRENWSSDLKYNELDATDTPVIRWLADGTMVDLDIGVPYDPREGPIFVDPDPFSGFNGSTFVYRIWGEMPNPDTATGLIRAREFISERYIDDRGNSWILAVRTSATWRHRCGIEYKVIMPYMVDGWGIVPRNESGDLIDTYSPVLPGEEYDPDTEYLSEFNVWDVTSGLHDEFEVPFFNAWNHPHRMYTPAGEHVRPRWDSAGPLANAFDFVTGEWLHLRKLMSVDSWHQVIGINVHAVAPPKDFATSWMPNPHWDHALLEDVNVVITDFNADPFDPSGAHRFNPVEELEQMTHDAYSPGAVSTERAVSRDFTFNGVWIFADSNNNGVFDPPVPAADGNGVTFVDYPMMPGRWARQPNINPFDPTWEYIAFPPGGGSPWWKLNLRLSGLSREFYEFIPESAKGYVEPLVESINSGDDPLVDYFIVVRPDSGYTDISTLPGDGTGIQLGRELRAFIEPRRFNPLLIDPMGDPAGSWDGGIYVDTAQMFVGTRDLASGRGVAMWQNNPLWMDHEPWFSQRTMDQTSAKPVRAGVEIHDLVMAYKSNNKYATYTDIEYPGVSFSDWLDPFGLTRSKFYWDESIYVWPWVVVTGGPADEAITRFFAHSFETVPFYQPAWDTSPVGPRSRVFPNPPPQPERPDYATWPATLLPDRYPELFDWPEDNRRARILRQYIDSESVATAMLGINVTGAHDPVTNQFNRLYLQQVTVAFWGPQFDPSHLLPLDPDGMKRDSGVLLIEDTARAGTFQGEFRNQVPVPLRGLVWRPTPEPVDLTGDGIADDINGDGVVDENDYAWVLRLRPQTAWPVPDTDLGGNRFSTPLKIVEAADTQKALGDEAEARIALAPDSLTSAEVVEGRPHWAKQPQRVYLEEERAKGAMELEAAKAIGPEGNLGDDLFIVVRTSDLLPRLSEFKAFVPATLPSRAANDRQAGVQFTPNNVIHPRSFVKSHPEEGPVQPWYHNELIKANVAAKVTDLTGSGQSIYRDGTSVPVLGIAMATNRPDLTVSKGENGLGGPTSFIVADAGWTPGAFAGYYLVDSRYESFEITGNTADRLTLLSGTPRDGRWRVVKNPTFFEQLVVELYDEARNGRFTIQNDLLPLDIDQRISGVALYRDNDAHPANRNGQFDPDIDIPIQLDYAPHLVGAIGEPNTQVRFVFSSPGTDNIPRPRAEQPRNRQWVPDTFGETQDDPFFGPDFFVVVRATDRMELGDSFRVAIVSWGPNTPTEPDPHNFPPPPAADRNEFDMFSEFPWGSRALGFITVFTEADFPPARMPTLGIPDNSGFNFIRTSANKATRTAVITAEERVIGPSDVVISSVSSPVLPMNVPAEGLTLLIYGRGFGTTPTVVLAGMQLQVVSATNTEIEVEIPGGTFIDADPITLTVTNPVTGKQTSRSDLFELAGGTPTGAPRITTITPNTGGSNDFPVVIFGTGFDNPEVFFGQTNMPVLSATTTRIDVAYPTGGMPKTGVLDVTVRNKTTQLSTVAREAFTYVNPPAVPRPCFIATAAYGTPLEPRLDTFRAFRDEALLGSAVGAAAVDAYYTVSPGMARVVAEHAWLAALARLALTPVAWALEHPVAALFAAATAALFAATALRRRTRRAAAHL